MKILLYRWIILASALLIAFTGLSLAAQSPYAIRIFIDNDTLTLFIPSVGTVSLEGFAYQVQRNGRMESYSLDEYIGFGIPFNAIPTPVCFRLREAGTTIPLPIECPQALTLTQDLAPANVFWYDPVANSPLVITLTVNGTPFGFCPSGISDCQSVFTPPTATPTPTSTPTPVPPHDGVNADWTPIIEVINEIEVVVVPPGCFTMGDANNRPAQTQCIDEQYYIGMTEVTNAQYRRCVDAGACPLPTVGGLYLEEYAADPVTSVTWEQAETFAAWWGGRLPTELEWEYAARGVESWIYPWGDEWVSSVVNSQSTDPYEYSAPVGSFPNGASWVGALDMCGNVWEMTSTHWHLYPYSEEGGDPERNVIRGSSFTETNRALFAMSARILNLRENSAVDIGFRIARDY